MDNFGPGKDGLGKAITVGICLILAIVIVGSIGLIIK